MVESSREQGDDLERLARVIPAIHEIVAGLYITNGPTAHNAAALAGLGISPEAVLCLDKRSHARYDDDGRVCVDLVDGENPDYLFAAAVHQLTALQARHDRVLVHCHAGRSRSIAVVAAYLLHVQPLSPGEALALVSRKRPCASVMPGLITNLERYALSIGRANG